MRKQAPKPMRYFESVFDIAYLLFDLVAGMIFLLHGLHLWAYLAFVLGIGDAFHLIPRVQMHLFGMSEKTEVKLGIGTAITSVTMTIFYLILYFIYRQMFPSIQVPNGLIYTLWISAIARILICLLPQNNWTSGGNATLSMIRNTIFGLTGFIMIYLFYQVGWTQMSLAIFFSFLFYFPVTFGAKKKPMLGALMLPKTIMYVWMLSMGLQLI